MAQKGLLFLPGFKVLVLSLGCGGVADEDASYKEKCMTAFQKDQTGMVPADLIAVLEH